MACMTKLPQIDLYHPPDVDQASEAWGANCGPCALAVALGLAVGDVRDAVSDVPAQSLLFGRPAPIFRGYMSITHMREASETMRRPVMRTEGDISPLHIRRWMNEENAAEFSSWRGARIIACVQWGGPWSGTRGASVYRHWVVFRYGYVGDIGPVHVYDVNAKHRVEQTTTHGTEDPPRVSKEIITRGGGWLTLDVWEREMVPRLLPERADGSWRIQWAGSVQP